MSRPKLVIQFDEFGQSGCDLPEQALETVAIEKRLLDRRDKRGTAGIDALTVKAKAAPAINQEY